METSMNSDRTQLSENNISFIKGEDRTPQQMAQFLKQGAQFRSFPYLLSQLCPDPDPKGRLISGLVEITGEERDKTARKVRNWFNGKNLPKNRETLFQICFLLKMDESKSNRLLGAVSDTGIHYRNPQELAYAFALRTGKSYPQARQLRERAMSIYREAAAGIEQSVRCENNPQAGLEKSTVHPPMYTRQLQEGFEKVQTEEEFFTFLQEHANELGMLHETAYKKFVELLDILQDPKSPVLGNVPEAHYTLDQVIDTYIRMHVPTQLRLSSQNSPNDSARRKSSSGSLTPLQKQIKKYWPNEEALVRMRTRTEDVSRKALILLYLVTEAFDTESEDPEEQYYYEEPEEDADTLLEIRWKKMNLFLNLYGMNLLDPGSPFDFLVIYSLRTRGEDAVQERMDQILELLFDNSGE